MIDTRPALRAAGVNPRGYEAPPATGEPWTAFEIRRGLAYRTRDTGEIVAFEICAKCECGFPRGDGKLGYGTGRALCFSCSNIEKAAQVHDTTAEIEALLSNQGLSTKAIAEAVKLKWGEAEKLLREMALKDRCVRRGNVWLKHGVKAGLFEG